MRLTGWRLIMLTGLGAIAALSGCASVPRGPGRYDLTVADQTGEPILWVKRSGKLVYGKKRDEAVLYLVKALSDLTAQVQQLKAEAAKVPPKAQPEPKPKRKPLPRPSLLESKP